MEVLKVTTDYEVLKRGNVFILKYFNEILVNENYNYKNKSIRSRVTKNYDFIKNFL